MMDSGAVTNTCPKEYDPTTVPIKERERKLVGAFGNLDRVPDRAQWRARVG